MSRSYKKSGGSGGGGREVHRQVRERVRDALKHYDPENDDDLELPEVKIKRKPSTEVGKVQPKWQRGPDKRDVE